jgi:hypothetical protein
MSGLISKRCKSCQTLYQSAMRAVALNIGVLLLYVASSFAKDRHCTLRVHVEANANDTAVFSSQSQFSGRNVLIEKVAAISEHDVTAFYPYRATDGSYGALFQLGDHGRIALDALSIERRGKTVFVFVNGRPITELQVDQRVADGKLYLPAGLGADDIQSMQKTWRLIGARKK